MRASAAIVSRALAQLSADGKDAASSMECYSTPAAVSPRRAAEFEAELKRQLASSRYVYSDAAEVAKSGKGIQVYSGTFGASIVCNHYMIVNL